MYQYGRFSPNGENVNFDILSKLTFCSSVKEHPAKFQLTVWDSGTPDTPKTPGLPRLRDSQDSRKTNGKSESDQSQVSQLSKPFSSSDSSLKMSAEGFCLLHKRMIHTNHGELLRIFDTYCRVWKAGGQATLTTSTKGGLLKANLDNLINFFAKIRFEGSPKETKSNYYYFPCLNCKTKTSIRHGTFFEAKNTGLRTIILLIYNFVMVSSLTISQKIHEVIIVGFY